MKRLLKIKVCTDRWVSCHGLGFSSKPGSTIATTLSYSIHIYRVNTPITQYNLSSILPFFPHTRTAHAPRHKQIDEYIISSPLSQYIALQSTWSYCHIYNTMMDAQPHPEPLSTHWTHTHCLSKNSSATSTRNTFKLVLHKTGLTAGDLQYCQ
jgi:hypothetical protein